MSKNIFLLDWKKLLVTILIAFIATVLHNTIDAIFQIEEAFFFILVVFVLPIYLIISSIVTSIHSFKNRKNKKY